MEEGQNRAVFLDRDGVLCEDTDYVVSMEKMHIFPFAREAVERIHNKGYLVIVVTNQSAVARGMMAEQTVRELNDFLRGETGVDAVYYCPHLPPERGKCGPYRIFCECRKPKTGMLIQAAGEFGICLKDSYMAGDRQSDIETGKRAGTKTVYIYGQEKKKISADLAFPTVLDFAKSLFDSKESFCFV
jgi:D-glycero-D-manno-heptose 1,7-bisphosphate phosphatase